MKVDGVNITEENRIRLMIAMETEHEMAFAPDPVVSLSQLPAPSIRGPAQSVAEIHGQPEVSVSLGEVA